MEGNVVRSFDREAPVATKDRILDAAESLFMEHGFEATSLRSITAAAGVNLAAVNYHFGSKEELFQAVLTRRLDPMNQERLDLLTALERAAAPEPLSMRADPVGDVRARAAPRARPRARRQGLPAPARPRLRRSGAVHPPVPVGPVRGDDRALQGGVRAGAAASCRRRSSRGGCTSSWARCRTRWRAPTRSKLIAELTSDRRGQRRDAAAAARAVPARRAAVAAAGSLRRRTRARRRPRAAAPAAALENDETTLTQRSLRC